jgi:sugar O-acyltransferase (sialic acid O-acetyltransferase NeuD family)
MSKLIIVGAGAFGREVLQWALQSNGGWDVAGFIDDNLDALNGIDCPRPILGSLDEWQPKSDEVFVVSLGSPKSKKEAVTKLANRGAVFGNIIHNTATLATTVKLGCGIILCPNTVISDSATIGNHVAINIGSSIGHDVRIGDYSILSSLCDVTGGVSLGECTFLGSSVCIIPYRTIGDYAYVSAGSAVMNNVRPNTKVMGVPAKKFEIKIDEK